MSAVRQYILSVICIAILCGVVQTLFSKGSTGSLVKLITGLMITVTAIGPLLRGYDLSFDVFLDKISADGNWVIAEGERAREQELSKCIKETAETYIMDKAAKMGAAITAEVKLNDETPPVPAAVTLRGGVSPYVKKQLEGYLWTDMGIPEDKQVWIS